MLDSPLRVPMDLGDFTAEEYELILSISGRRYLCRYAEATVDEVLHMIADGPMAKDGKEAMDRRRAIVTRFLQKHLAEGDPAQFEKDMQTVPFQRDGVPFDISRLYQSFLGRVKKKPDSGASPSRSGPEGSGSPASSPS